MSEARQSGLYIQQNKLPLTELLNIVAFMLEKLCVIKRNIDYEDLLEKDTHDPLGYKLFDLKIQDSEYYIVYYVHGMRIICTESYDLILEIHNNNEVTVNVDLARYANEAILFFQNKINDIIACYEIEFKKIKEAEQAISDLGIHIVDLTELGKKND